MDDWALEWLVLDDADADDGVCSGAQLGMWEGQKESPLHKRYLIIGSITLTHSHSDFHSHSPGVIRKIAGRACRGPPPLL